MQNVDKLQRVLPFLFYYEPFFSDVFRYINKVPTDKIPTAGVRVNKNAEVEMLYNPEFFNSKNISEIYFIIKHEVYHILLGHIFERVRQPFKLWNISTDCVINKMICDDLQRISYQATKDVNFDINYRNVAELLKTLIMPDSLYEEFYKYNKDDKALNGKLWNCLINGSSEQIFDILLKKMPESFYKDYEFDVHFDGSESLGGDGDSKMSQEEKKALWDSLSDIAKEKFQKQIEEIVKEAQSRQYGNIPYNIQGIIQKLLAKKTVDWKVLLSYFIKTTIRGHKYNTIRKINKRFPYLYSGQKHRRYAKVLVGVDESGSMSDNLLTLLFSEIKGLAEIVQFDVIPFDVEVNEKAKFTWKKGVKLQTYNRTKYGGTSFDPVSRYASEHKYDGLIIVTDMGSYFPPTYGVKRMWLTTPEHARYCDWKDKELVVQVNTKKI